MCGIAAIIRLDGAEVPGIGARLSLMGRLLAHRGPDDAGAWAATDRSVGLAHRRLSIIDVSRAGHQPMIGGGGTVIAFNGEIYNYRELARELRDRWAFQSATDTETILAAYDRYGDDFLDHLRGMFAFALWDPRRRRLVCARDRFGIKPLYYAECDGCLYVASEIKALVPFLERIETDSKALAQYLTFQFTLDEHTLFEGVKQLMPGHVLSVDDGRVRVRRYWDVQFDVDWNHSPHHFHERLRGLLDDSVDVHLRADVPIGSYMSGGIDSSLIGLLASEHSDRNREAFHGRFSEPPGYDESEYARLVSERAGMTLHEVDIGAGDFVDNIERVIYHLDHPVAGPGSFPQFMVSELAARHVKVVLGGQGGDEIFGGYARYLLAYFEQCIKAAIDGTHRDGNFVVTPESIIPNLGLLREYKPLIRSFWAQGLFEDLDRRYFRLVDRSADMHEEVQWDILDREAVWTSFDAIFNSRRNVEHEAYFDSMTHFDFKTLLPALLHVEDRMSMAHGLESRVPLLDHPVVEFAATVPADVKFKDGQMKIMLKRAYEDVLPRELLDRRDKMGFPVPLSEWFSGELRTFVNDLFHSRSARERPFMNADAVLANFREGARFSRKTWGLLSLEIWQRTFHDRAHEYRRMFDDTKDEGEEVFTT